MRVEISIDPATQAASVPQLILQPIVENAIRHGIAPFARVGWLDIRAHAENGMLRIDVQDNGPGLSPEQQACERAGAFRSGVGIANTRARLQQLYGPQHRFEMRNGTTQGLTVTMLIPAGERPGAERVETPLSETMQPATVSG